MSTLINWLTGDVESSEAGQRGRCRPSNKTNCHIDMNADLDKMKETEHKGGGHHNTNDKVVKLSGSNDSGSKQIVTKGSLPHHRSNQSDTTGSSFIYKDCKFNTSEEKRLGLIASRDPNSSLEHAMAEELEHRAVIINHQSNEIKKLKTFIAKRKKRYTRRQKEAAAPRKPLSAYNVFMKGEFKKLRVENDAILNNIDSEEELKRLASSTILKDVARIWNLLSSEEKAPYEQKAREDKRRYEEEMAAYTRPKRQVCKRNKTGYNLFYSHFVITLKQSGEGVPSERGKVARLVGDAWKELSGSKKQNFDVMADEANKEAACKKRREEKGREDTTPYLSGMQQNNDMNTGHTPPQALPQPCCAPAPYIQLNYGMVPLAQSGLQIQSPWEHAGQTKQMVQASDGNPAHLITQPNYHQNFPLGVPHGGQTSMYGQGKQTQSPPQHQLNPVQLPQSNYSEAYGYLPPSYQCGYHQNYAGCNQHQGSGKSPRGI